MVALNLSSLLSGSSKPSKNLFNEFLAVIAKPLAFSPTRLVLSLIPIAKPSPNHPPDSIITLDGELISNQFQTASLACLAKATAEFQTLSLVLVIPLANP